jgi:hypothetical protein
MYQKCSVRLDVYLYPKNRQRTPDTPVFSAFFLLRLGNAHKQNVVAAEFDGLVVGKCNRLAGPQILALLRPFEAEFGKAQVERMGGHAVLARSTLENRKGLPKTKRRKCACESRTANEVDGDEGQRGRAAGAGVACCAGHPGRYSKLRCPVAMLGSASRRMSDAC